MTNNTLLAPIDLMTDEFNGFARSLLPNFDDVSEDDWRASRRAADEHPVSVDVIFQQDAAGGLAILDGRTRFAAIASLRQLSAYRFHLFTGDAPLNFHHCPGMDSSGFGEQFIAVPVADLSLIVEFIADNICDDGRNDHHKTAGRVLGSISLALEREGHQDAITVHRDAVAALTNFLRAFGEDVSAEHRQAMCRIDALAVRA